MEQQEQEPEQRTAATAWPPGSQHSGKGKPPPLISRDESSNNKNNVEHPKTISARLPAYFPGPVCRGAGCVHSQLRPPSNISQMALLTVLGRALMETSGIYTPASQKEIAVTFSPPVDIEEMENGVVYPITQEAMINYGAIIKVPEL